MIAAKFKYMGDEIRSKPLNNISRVREGIRRDLIKIDLWKLLCLKHIIFIDCIE
jgi:hypothetical protein